jgi:CrcB protein
MIVIALAGGAGAALRLVVDGLVRNRVGTALPWGTLAINIVGSFALGWLVGAGAGRTWLDVAGTGFLGGFTTFSAASFETARLASDRRWPAAVGYGAGSLVASVGAASLGYFLAAATAF